MPEFQLLMITYPQLHLSQKLRALLVLNCNDEISFTSPQLVAISHEGLTPVYTSLQEPNSKRRKHEDSQNVKCEPGT